MMPLRAFLKSMVDDGKYSQSEVARRAGVSQCVISKIIVGNSIREPAPATYKGISTAFAREWETFVRSHTEVRDHLLATYGWAVPARTATPTSELACARISAVEEAAQWVGRDESLERDPVVTAAVGPRLHAATSRYGNPIVARSGLVPIGITRYPPRFRLGYELRANLYDLAPTFEMLQLAKQPDGHDRFREAYLERLRIIGPASILAQLEGLQGEAAGLVLLCYEDITSGEAWCHRLLLGDWLRKQAGLDVTELPDPGKFSKRSASATASRTPPAARRASPRAMGSSDTELSGDP